MKLCPENEQNFFFQTAKTLQQNSCNLQQQHSIQRIITDTKRYIDTIRYIDTKRQEGSYGEVVGTEVMLVE